MAKRKLKVHWKAITVSLRTACNRPTPGYFWTENILEVTCKMCLKCYHAWTNKSELQREKLEMGEWLDKNMECEEDA